MDIKDFKDQLTDLPPEKRKLFAELLDLKKTLTQYDIKLIKELGYKIETVAQEL